MSLSFRYWVDANYPSVSTEDPTPDCSIPSKSKGLRIRNCLKKAKQLVSIHSAFVTSLFRSGKATEFVSPAVDTDEEYSSNGHQDSSESAAGESETQRFSFDFLPAAETKEDCSQGYDVVASDTRRFSPDFPAPAVSTGSSSADEDSTALSLPLASLFYFDDINSQSDVESSQGDGTEKTVRFRVTPPGRTGHSARLEPELLQEDCKMEQRVWETGSIEEETEFFKYYLKKVYKEPESLMASFPDGRLAEWNRLLASSKKIEEIRTRRRNYTNGSRRRTYSFCFSLHVQD